MDAKIKKLAAKFNDGMDMVEKAKVDEEAGAPEPVVSKTAGPKVEKAATKEVAKVAVKGAAKKTAAKKIQTSKHLERVNSGIANL